MPSHQSISYMEEVSIINDRQCLMNVRLGKSVKIYNFVNAYGCTIGDGSKVGSFVEIQKGVTIGKNCKVSSHTFICEGVHIADNVFIGHNVTFINDKFPRATNDDQELQTEENWLCIPTYVSEGASIGSSVTILCGVHVGKNALIGAGSVVLKDVPENTVFAGNPAKFIRTVTKIDD
jgi:acetyltransferase-like isoleucine patch superfamily enzyme